jgi:hypothetical protein
MHDTPQNESADGYAAERPIVDEVEWSLGRRYVPISGADSPGRINRVCANLDQTKPIARFSCRPAQCKNGPAGGTPNDFKQQFS